jgi:hypothetical protein
MRTEYRFEALRSIGGGTQSETRLLQVETLKVIFQQSGIHLKADIMGAHFVSQRGQNRVFPSFAGKM